MEDWSYQPSPHLQRSFAERLGVFPREPDLMVYTIRTALHVALRSFFRAYFRLRIHGREHLPRDTSFVMIGNHTSHLDALCLLSSLRLRALHRAFPAAAADYFFASLPRTIFSSIFVNGMPFDRLEKGAESLELCRHLLATPGHVLILFPEGTRSVSGEIGRFRSGIGRVVAGTPIPVVPCRLIGASRAFPKGALIPRPASLELWIGPPRTFSDIAADDPAAVARMCESLRGDVVALGQR